LSAKTKTGSSDGHASDVKHCFFDRKKSILAVGFVLLPVLPPTPVSTDEDDEDSLIQFNIGGADDARRIPNAELQENSLLVGSSATRGADE
jgi:hypothetical protein